MRLGKSVVSGFIRPVESCCVESFTSHGIFLHFMQGEVLAFLYLNPSERS
jgi:hypothetical protein